MGKRNGNRKRVSPAGVSEQPQQKRATAQPGSGEHAAWPQPADAGSLVSGSQPVAGSLVDALRASMPPLPSAGFSFSKAIPAASPSPAAKSVLE